MVANYATLDQCKARLGIATLDTAEDAVLDAVLTAVSRQIDDYTGRRFYATTETRTYTAEDAHLLLVDDLLTVSALTTDEDGDRTYGTAWATTDYDLAPDNAALEGRPYWALRVSPAGTNTFPVGMPRGVRVAGSWGYSATVPTVIIEACLHQAQLVYRLKDHVFGVAGGGDWEQRPAPGMVIGLAAVVKAMLAPYRRLRVA